MRSLQGRSSFQLADYYRAESVRERMAEFLGATPFQPATAAYIVATNGITGFSEHLHPDCLANCLDEGLDVERSLWDRVSLIVDLDLEYHHFDDPTIPWLDPGRTFALQTSVLSAALDFLRKFSIDPLVLASGRGFHLVWSVSRKATAFRRLTELGHVSAPLKRQYELVSSPSRDRMGPALGLAYAGLGQVLEFVAQSILNAAARSCAVPIQITAIEVGPGPAGREIVSLDISEYGDPLHTRHIRVPFSAYLKPRNQCWNLSESALLQILPVLEIPLSGMTPVEAASVARSPKLVIELSKHTSARIPPYDNEMKGLIEEYENSGLMAFHREFYGPARDNWRRMLSYSPPCVSWLFEHPNDWLLRPAALQHVVRVLTALDWTPQAISEAIHDAYRIDAGWGRTWKVLEPASRAEFYTRLFAGMIATGADRLIDLNCVSHREKGYCMSSDCRWNLRKFGEKLQQKGYL